MTLQYSYGCIVHYIIPYCSIETEYCAPRLHLIVMSFSYKTATILFSKNKLEMVHAVLLHSIEFTSAGRHGFYFIKI